MERIICPDCKVEMVYLSHAEFYWAWWNDKVYRCMVCEEELSESDFVDYEKDAY